MSMLGGRLDHLVAPADLGHDLHVGLEGQQRRERLADQRLVVGEQETDLGRLGGGLALGHDRTLASMAVAAGVTGPVSAGPAGGSSGVSGTVATSLKP